MKPLVFATILGLASISHAEPLHVQIIAGQSNAEGYGISTDLTVNHASLVDPYPNVLYRASSGDFTPLQPVQRSWGLSFGPELSMGRYLDRFTDEKILIIKYALGSTSLAINWNPETGTQYNTMMKRVKSGLNYYLARGYEPTIQGFTWIQGEEDARQGSMAPVYATNLENFISSVREDLESPNLPMVVARINAPGRVYRDLVRNAEVSVSDQMDQAIWMDTDTLPLRDLVHYSGEGQYTLGQRLAKHFAIDRNLPTYKYSVMQTGTVSQSFTVPEPSGIAIVLLFVALGLVWFTVVSKQQQ
jgi:hypothetical protein